MQRVRPSAPALAGLVPYDPKYLPARVYLNANESPYGLSGDVVRELADALADQLLHRYPDPLAKSLRAQIAKLNGVSDGNVLLGNGGDELLFDIMLAYGGAGRKLLTAPPSFSSYELDARLTGTTVVEVPRLEREGPTRALAVDEEAILRRVAQGDIDVVMLASPNNPTGDALSERFVLELLDASDALVLIDHAYIEFTDERFDMTRHLGNHDNLVLLRTFSKAYALAGVRLGYLLASSTVIGELCKVRQPYSVDTFSVLAGRAALGASREIAGQVAQSRTERERLARALEALPGVTVFESEANFLLLRVAGAHDIWQRLYDEWGILIRDFSAASYLTDCLRVSIGLPQENDEFLEAFAKLLKTSGK
ncbi:MAG: histidinol-phosphate transaminase [Coriobacteriales bacterium]|jgi:histidinol-phosphate aminotransferase|nr:histidinol-phosphate transaminase [Coriobacteriales bacterium]